MCFPRIKVSSAGSLAPTPYFQLVPRGCWLGIECWLVWRGLQGASVLLCALCALCVLCACSQQVGEWKSPYSLLFIWFLTWHFLFTILTVNVCACLCGGYACPQHMWIKEDSLGFYLLVCFRQGLAACVRLGGSWASGDSPMSSCYITLDVLGSHTSNLVRFWKSKFRSKPFCNDV